MEQMNEKIAKLKEIVAGSERMVFWLSGCFYSERDSGFPQCGWIV